MNRKTVFVVMLAVTLALVGTAGLAAQSVNNSIYAAERDDPVARSSGLYSYSVFEFTGSNYKEYVILFGVSREALEALPIMGGHNTPRETSSGTYTQSGNTVNVRASNGNIGTLHLANMTKVPGLDVTKWPDVKRGNNFISITAPAELIGTWVRKGADSGRAFDSTMIVTASQIRVTYSDGRPDLIRTDFTAIKAVSNDATVQGNKAMNKAGEFPSGWFISYTENGKKFWYVYFLNVAKNKLTQYGLDDLTDIWVKQ